MRHRLTLLNVLALVLLTLGNVLLLAVVIAGVLHAQAEPPAVADKTGLFGPLIDRWFIPVVGVVQSGITWLIAHGLGQTWKKINVLFQYTILYGVGLLVSYVGVKAGWYGLTVTPEGLQALGVAGVLAGIPTAAAGAIYKLGGHRVPEVSRVASGPRG